MGLVSVGQWGRDSGRALFSFSNGSGLMLTLHVKLVLILMLHMLPSHSLDFVIQDHPISYTTNQFTVQCLLQKKKKKKNSINYKIH